MLRWVERWVHVGSHVRFAPREQTCAAQRASLILCLGAPLFARLSGSDLNVAFDLVHFVHGERLDCGAVDHGSGGDVEPGAVALAHDRRPCEKASGSQYFHPPQPDLRQVDGDSRRALANGYVRTAVTGRKLATAISAITMKVANVAP